MAKFDQLAEEKSLQKTVDALKANGIEAFVSENAEEAKNKVLELIPRGSEVMTSTSETANALGLTDIFDNSGDYLSTRKEIESLPDSASRNEGRRINNAPDYVVGSVHAVTEDGKVLIASNTGSQLPSYSYAAEHVIWVIGTQKITKDFDEAVERIYSYVLPLESQRMMGVYGMPSNVSKLLVVNKEVNPDRIKIVFVKQKLGF